MRTEQNGTQKYIPQPHISETSKSSWIESIGYYGTGKNSEGVAVGFLAVFLTSGKAILYAGVPSHVAGLLKAGTPLSDEMGIRHSVGRAYHRLVRGKFDGQMLEEEERVRELKKLMRRESSI